MVHWFLTELGADLPDFGVQIYTQKKTPYSNSIPDATICNVSFNVYIESKITAPIENNQLIEHRKNINLSQNSFLLYITNDKTRPAILDGLELWTNWNIVLDLLKTFCCSFAEDAVLEYLVNEFEKLLQLFIFSKSKKRGKKVTRDNEEELDKLILEAAEERVIIVGGHWGEAVALKHLCYVCQPDRFFLPARYLTFCHQNRIKYLFKIVNTPIESVDLEESRVDISNKTEYFKVTDPTYVITQKGANNRLRKFFKLELEKEFSPVIENDATNSNGKRCAFTQKQRYTTYDKITNAKKTSDL